jgi:hypothetical protein
MSKIARSDAEWAHDLREHAKAIRLVWSEVGLPYIETGRDEQGPADPRNPGSGGSPEIGSPMPANPNVPGSDEATARWQEVDDTIKELFSHELLSGNLSAADDFVHALSLVPLGDGGPDANALPVAKGDRSSISVSVEYQDKINHLRTGLRSWEGKAAENFAHYLDEMDKALAMYQDRVAAAWLAIANYRRAIEGIRNDALDLVKAAYDKFDEIDQTKEKQKVTVLSSLVTAGVSLVGVGAAGVGTGGLASVAAWGFVLDAFKSGAVGYGILQMGAGTKGEAVENVAEGAKKIVQDAEKAADTVKEALYAVTKSMTGVNLTGRGTEDGPKVDDPRQREAGMRPDRPDIVTDDKFDPNEFRHDDQPPDSIDRADRDDLVKEPEREPDQARDHSIQDPKDEPDSFWDITPPIPVPKPDAYQEQGPAAGGAGGRAR